jgi:hypothetical protein
MAMYRVKRNPALPNLFHRSSTSGGKVWGEKILVQNPFFLPNSKHHFSPRKRPPQTPQTLLQNRTRIASILDVGIEGKPSHNLARELEKKPVFQLIFLSEDENQGVEVKEVDEIDFTEVKMRVENGDSVFITRRENEKIDISSLKHTTKKKTR